MNSSLRTAPVPPPLPSADDSSCRMPGRTQTSSQGIDSRGKPHGPTPGLAVQLPTAARIVTALSIPRSRAVPAQRTLPLPMTRLPLLPRDGSMLYGIARVDTSGRVAHREISVALGWDPDDRLDVSVTASAIILRQSPDGMLKVPRVPYIVIPANARHRCSITAGDNVLLAAAPDYGTVIVHTMSALDDMLARYHSAATAGRTP